MEMLTTPKAVRFCDITRYDDDTSGCLYYNDEQTKRGDTTRPFKRIDPIYSNRLHHYQKWVWGNEKCLKEVSPPSLPKRQVSRELSIQFSREHDPVFECPEMPLQAPKRRNSKEVTKEMFSIVHDIIN